MTNDSYSGIILAFVGNTYTNSRKIFTCLCTISDICYRMPSDVRDIGISIGHSAYVDRFTHNARSNMHTLTAYEQLFLSLIFVRVC